MVQCAGCDLPILDRFLLNVLDRAWHAKCVQCCDCKNNLTEKCFSRDGKLYCRNDFYRRFGTKCAGCTQGISPSDLVRRARNKVFHLKCFTCMVCRKQLSTGEELYVLDENKFICKDDYLSKSIHGADSELGDDADDLDLKAETHSTATATPPSSGTTPTTTGTPNSTSGEGGLSLSSGGGGGSTDHTTHGHSNNANNSNNSSSNNNNSNNNNSSNNNNNNAGSEKESRDSGGSVDGDRENRDHENTAPDENNIGAKRRGPRTTIKAKQLETLKAAFAATPKPTRHIREQLAQETGLNMRVIQVWFQNRRSKERRMKQLSTLGARRTFFRNHRRMRTLRPGMSPDGLDDSPEMVANPGFTYFSDNSNQGEFGYGNQGFYDFFPGQPPQGPDVLGFPGMGAQSPAVPTPTSMEQAISGPMGTGNVNLGADAPYLPHNDILSQRSSPDSVLNLPPVDSGFGPPPRNADAAAAVAAFTALSHPPMAETPVW